MSKTVALFKRMSPYLAEKARNLIDAMLLSSEEIGWDSQQQLIVNNRVYQYFCKTDWITSLHLSTKKDWLRI